MWNYWISLFRVSIIIVIVVVVILNNYYHINYIKTYNFSNVSRCLCVCLVLPPLVSIFGLFLSLLSVIMSSFLSSCVCLLSMIILCIYGPMCLIWSGLLVTPVCVSLALSCLDSLKTVIWVTSSSVFLDPLSCVHRDK